MKYYLIVGEASGDLHASHLITSLIKEDSAAQFRFIGGDNMIAAAGDHGSLLRHYRDLAYMGFVPVLMHLRTILNGMKECKKDIVEWNPDKVILVDYAGFNLSIAKYLREQRSLHAGKGWDGSILYYIAPKIWAWKEYRIKNFKRDIDQMFSILPFEKEFFEGKHHYPIHYVGNPTADEVREFKAHYTETKEAFCLRNGLDPSKPIIALLPGSRRQEIKDNLTAMLAATKKLSDYQMVIAGAPSIEKEYYNAFITNSNVILLPNKVKEIPDTPTVPLSSNNSNLKTSPHGGLGGAPHGGLGGATVGSAYPLLYHSTAALVTSGTATLETACFNIPQVVCYKTPVPKLCRWGFNHIISCKYISLVNLIANQEIVPELFADRFSVKAIRQNLLAILPMGYMRETMLEGYKTVHQRLGDTCAPDNAARIITHLDKTHA